MPKVPTKPNKPAKKKQGCLSRLISIVLLLLLLGGLALGGYCIVLHGCNTQSQSDNPSSYSSSSYSSNDNSQSSGSGGYSTGFIAEISPSSGYIPQAYEVTISHARPGDLFYLEVENASNGTDIHDDGPKYGDAYGDAEFRFGTDSGVAPGSYLAVVNDSEGDKESLPFTVAAYTSSNSSFSAVISPSSGYIPTTYDVSVTGARPGENIYANIEFASTGQVTLNMSQTVSADGSADFLFHSDDTDATGDYYIYISDEEGHQTSVTFSELR